MQPTTALKIRLACFASVGALLAHSSTRAQVSIQVVTNYSGSPTISRQSVNNKGDVRLEPDCQRFSQVYILPTANPLPRCCLQQRTIKSFRSSRCVMCLLEDVWGRSALSSSEILRGRKHRSSSAAEPSRAAPDACWSLHMVSHSVGWQKFGVSARHDNFLSF